MLSHLEPAVELTGGPWYTDNELDTEFIKNLYDTILHYIREHVRPPSQACVHCFSSSITEFPKAEKIRGTTTVSYFCSPILPYFAANPDFC